MTGHLGLMIIFSLCVSTVFAVLMREDPREQLQFGATLCAGFMGGGLLLGWLLYVFPS